MLARAAAVGNGLLVVPVRVLGFRIDGNAAPGCLALGCCDVDDVLRADQRQLAVPLGRAVGAVIQRGAAHQSAQFVQGEVADGPVVAMVFAVHHQCLKHGFLVVRVNQVAQILGRAVCRYGGVFHIDQHTGGGALAPGHIGIGLGNVCDIGAVAEPCVMARHQLAVTRQVHVQLNHVGACINGFFIGHLGLLGVQPRVATVGDHLRLFAVQRQKLGLGFWLGAITVATAAGSQCHDGHQDQARGCIASCEHVCVFADGQT